MDTTTVIWIIVGIVVVLAIVIIALVLTARGRRTRRFEQQHERAERLRADARETELAAREHEAQAARAQADAAAANAAAEAAKARAAEAAIDAERRAGTIDEHRDEAAGLRERQAETLRKADDVDPYVGDDRTSATGSPDTVDGRTAPTVRDADGHDVRDATVDGGRAAQTRDEAAAGEQTAPPPTRTERA
jgi:type II secretory pathway pseudopilin PulG